MESNKLSSSRVFRLTKQDRLTNYKHIQLLFERGKCLKLYPLKVFFIQKEREQLLCNKVLFAVSKKQLPSAVARNRIKRLLREAYRLHKHILDCSSGISKSKLVFLIGYVYTGGNSKIPYALVKERVMSSLHYFKGLLNRK